jgi:hypothetical protein
MRILLTCFVLVFVPYPVLAGFTGRVVRVLDGDAIKVLHNTRAVVNAPTIALG